MARRFFDPEGLVWKPLGFIGDLVMLSLLWFLCSVPLVTLGAATAALYDTAVHVMRRGETAIFARFFGTLRRELKEGILLTLLWAGIALGQWLILYGLTRLIPAAQGTAVSLIEMLLIFLFLAAASWVFPTLSRFTMGVGALSSVCLRLAPGNALRSAALALLNALLIAACLRFILPLMFAPALVAYLSSFLIEPVFERYETTAE